MKQNLTNPKLRKQNGSILLVTLLVVALIEIILVAFMIQHQASIRSARNYFLGMEMITLAQGGEDWAKATALQNASSSLSQTVILLPKTPIQGGYIEGTLSDAQGKFNINNIVSQKMLYHFKDMISQFSLNDSLVDPFLPLEEKIKKYSYLIYMGKPIYLLNSVTELLTLPGFNHKTYEMLLPHIMVLPEMTPLNVNSASNYALLTVSSKINLDIANTIIQKRKEMGGFSQISQFLNLEILKEIPININDITIKSNYFLSTIHVHYHNNDLTLYSLIKINSAESVSIKWRSFETL